MEAIIVLGVIAVLIFIAIVAKKSLLKTGEPVPGARIGNENTGALQTYGWKKFQNQWAVPMAILLMLPVWFIVSPDSFEKAASAPTFWAGLMLVVVVFGILLSTSKEFEKRWDRKFLMAVALIGGILLMASRFIPADMVATATQAQMARPGGSSPQARRINFQINPNNWVNCKLPAGCSGFATWGAPGDVEMVFAIPRPDTIRIGNFQHINFDLPYREFKARGTAGILFFDGLRF